MMRNLDELVKALNSKADLATELLTQTQARYNNLRIGVEAIITCPPPVNTLAFAKCNGSWRIEIAGKHFNECKREVRIAAIKYLPNLEQQIVAILEDLV